VALSASTIRTACRLGLRLSLQESLSGRHVQSRLLSPEVIAFAEGLNGDLYRPADDVSVTRGRPCVVVVHGGAWRWGDKGENAWLSHALALHGCVVFDVQYRLAPAGNWRDAVSDIRSAVEWVRSHAAEFNVDAKHVFLLGRSAGGHLALLAASDAKTAGVVAFYAPTDLPLLYEWASGGSAAEVRTGLVALLGGSPRLALEEYRRASPLRHTKRGDPPTLLIHGTWDAVVPVEHSDRLQVALQRAGVRAHLVRIPFARHAFDVPSRGLASQLAREAVVNFLDGIVAVREHGSA
jgi:acetyl esterase/lipase